MRDFGGYLGIDALGVYDSKRHPTDIYDMHGSPYRMLFNTAHSALEFYLNNIHAKTVWVPDFTCKQVYSAVKSSGAEIEIYHVGEDLLPVEGELPEKFNNDEYLMYTNYFGICDTKVQQICQKYNHVIVDAAEAYYQSETDLVGTGAVAMIKSPRKFFPVPDGGILDVYYQDESQPRALMEIYDRLPKTLSYQYCKHLLKRTDLNADAGLAAFEANEKRLETAEICKMSDLSATLLGLVQVDQIAECRRDNFSKLDEYFNAFPNHIPDGVPMTYPALFLTAEMADSFREVLDSHRVHTPILWEESSSELSRRIVHLPIDQSIDKEFYARIRPLQLFYTSTHAKCAFGF
jgi:hypothetical protein